MEAREELVARLAEVWSEHLSLHLGVTVEPDTVIDVRDTPAGIADLLIGLLQPRPMQIERKWMFEVPEPPGGGERS